MGADFLKNLPLDGHEVDNYSVNPFIATIMTGNSNSLPEGIAIVNETAPRDLTQLEHGCFMVRASQRGVASDGSGTLYPEVERIVQAIAKDMARADHEAEVTATTGVENKRTSLALERAVTQTDNLPPD